MSQSCFHCGEHIPTDVDLVVLVDGVARRMCCRGCQAVCQAIADNRLTDYYRHRQVLPATSLQGSSAGLPDLQLFDHPEFQKSFVRPVEGDEREADLILEGITCAACVWLNEKYLSGLPGVRGVQVNYATRRARVRWAEGAIHLSQILAAVADIGYRAHPFDPGRADKLALQERRSALWRLFVAGFGMMQVMMYAVPGYVAAEGDMSASVVALMQWASLVLTAPVVLFSAGPFFGRALRDIRMRRLGMDVPVALGVGGAFVASVWATVVGGEVYFDSVTMFVFFLLAARYLELTARQRALRGRDALGRMVPAFAHRVAADGRIEERVPASLLVRGDHLLVRPGETIVVDGVVLMGSGEVDESWLSGESRPLLKTVGDMVLAGSVNGSQPLDIEARSVGEATRLATIRRLMERASAERPRIATLADQMASRFTLLLLLVAAATGCWWWIFEPARALEILVAVLVVSCPCALSLATPVALTAAIDAFARLGVLVTRGRAVETLARASHFAFDKTGTLTKGVLSVVRIVCGDSDSRSAVLRIASALECGSEHVIARAITAEAPQVVPASSVTVEVGYGLSGTVDGVRYALGRQSYVARLVGCDWPASWQLPSDQTTVFLGREGGWVGAIVLADSLRAEAAQAIAALRAAGCGLSILSGDGAGPVSAVAASLSIQDARSELTPEDKHAALGQIQGRDVVAMVGDGVNDAPVLARAHLSIAMSGGTELARNQADIVLLNDRLDALPAARALASKTFRIIGQNLTWAFAYNVLAIPAAMAGVVTPWMAGIGMGGSSLLVVLNALRIARIGEKGVGEWKKVSIS